MEADALRAILDAAPPEAFDRETVCTGWSVRDVLSHCAAALSRTGSGDLHRFRPEDNQADVDERRTWKLEDVLSELYQGYTAAASIIEEAGGALDGVGFGEWMHGGDVRDAIGAPRPYTSAGVDLALDLLLERSSLTAKLPLHAEVAGTAYRFGGEGDVAGTVVADLETFVRLCGGRRPDPDRYSLDGCVAEDLILFS